jgi:hypothetical protein
MHAATGPSSLPNLIISKFSVQLKVWLAATGISDDAPDRQRIAARTPVEMPEALQTLDHATFVENFYDELRRKVPAGGMASHHQSPREFSREARFELRWVDGIASGGRQSGNYPPG